MKRTQVWAMEAWEGWQPASLTPCPLWPYLDMATGSDTSLGFSIRESEIVHRSSLFLASFFLFSALPMQLILSIASRLIFRFVCPPKKGAFIPVIFPARSGYGGP